MENVERIVASEVESPKEENIDRALRPLKLADYVGQSAIKEQLSIFITAAKQRHEPLDHLLLFGPPGLGKPLWRTSSPTKWASICVRPQDRF